MKLSVESGCLAKKNPGICIPGSLPSELLIARIYSDHWPSKTPMVSNRFWHIVSVVKEQGPPVQQKGQLQPRKYAKGRRKCQQRINEIHRYPQRALRASGMVGCARRSQQVDPQR